MHDMTLKQVIVKYSSGIIKECKQFKHHISMQTNYLAKRMIFMIIHGNKIIENSTSPIIFVVAVVKKIQILREKWGWKILFR